MLERLGYRRALTLDQALSSLTNFLLSFGLLWVTDPETFGSFAALLLVVGFTTEFARSSIGEALLLYSEGRLVTLRGIIAGVAPLLAVALALMLLIGWTTVLTWLLVVTFALSLVAVLVQEVVRYSAIAVQRSDVALRMSLSWFVIQVPFAIAAMTQKAPLGIVAAWGLGCVAALISGGVSWKTVSGERHRTFFSQHRSKLVRFGFELFLDRGSAYIVVGIVGGVVGYVGLGQIHSARMLFTLANPVLFLVPAMLIPVFEADATRARRILVGAVTVAAIVSVVIAVVAWWNPVGLTALIAQENWEGARPLIPWTGLSFGLGVIRLLYRTFLRSFDRVQVVTRLRILDSVLVAAASVGGALLFGAIGAVAGRTGALGAGSLAWTREAKNTET